MAAVGRPGDEPAVTTAGTRLDADYERRLAAEAEAGFEPATLIRCQVGRPSPSGRAGHFKQVDLRVDDQATRRSSGSPTETTAGPATSPATPSTATSKQAEEDRQASR
jgi:hypothetical protein